MITYPDSIESKIGFDAVRAMVSSLCLSQLGRGKCAEMTISGDFDVVSRRLACVAEMCAIMASDEDFPLSGIHDLTDELKAMRVPGTRIAEEHLMPLRTTLATLQSLAAFFSTRRRFENPDSPVPATPYPALDALAMHIGDFKVPLREIDRVADKFGQVKDSASPELSRLRQQLSAMQGSIANAMRRVIANAVKAGIIDADTAPSIRDGRPVIPVAPMHKRRLPGIVHDESASGKTFFIEPAEVVEASNRLREQQIEERREVMRILTVLADTLRPYLPQMLDSYDILADFDFIHAKAVFADKNECRLPSLHRDMQLELYHACHPVLKQALAKQGKEVVPLDIRLDSASRLLIISGPNAGGKSVTLKTVAIAQYMTQCGMLPPVYENSHLSVTDGIFIDIGDDQSMENELSTYSSHLRNMKFFVTHGTDRTLVLIDEFGSGTEPQIGGAIAQTVLARFARLGMWGVITTHFQNLKRFAEETEGLVNGSMLYDRQLMRPLFKLSIGVAGSSFALEIARKTGLPDDIIKQAEELVGSDYVNLDRYLLDVARDKRYWENKRMAIKQKERKVDALLEKCEEDAEQLRLRRREIIDDARAKAAQILEQSNAAIERTIHDIKEANAERERTLQARRQLAADRARIEAESVNAADEHPMLAGRKRPRKAKQQPAAESLEPIRVGDHVLLDGSGTVGEVLELSGSNALVAFGMLKTQVKTARLKRTMRKIESGASKKAQLITSVPGESLRDRQLQFNTELDVRGMRADEAVQAVMYFLDDAIQYGMPRVRILHGTGTGALRQCIRQYLATAPGIDSYRDEDVRFGGAGVTVVDLR